MTAPGAEIRWAWVFLDAPRPLAAEALRWWSTRTDTAPGSRRGPQEEFATLDPSSGPAWLKFQVVDRPDGPVTHHLDLDVDDPFAAATIATGFGARHVADGGDHVVLESPGGFTFCFTTWDRDSAGSIRDHAGASLADQLCLDIPASSWDRELEFWAAVGNWRIAPSRTHPEFHWASPDLPIRLLFQRLDESPEGAIVGAHLDLACTDREREVARHVAAGAAVVHHRSDRPGWTVLVDPWGTTYCCTDRLPATGAPRPRRPPERESLGRRWRLVRGPSPRR